MMQRVTTLILSATVIIAAALTFTACDGGGNNSGNGDGFDREAMLINYADNLIIPAYEDLNAKTGALSAAAAAFTSGPTAEKLITLQQAWAEAFLSWQYANAYNFGPAGEEGIKKALVQEIGTWPVSTSKIETAISSGTYNLEDFNRDARGFLAIEYLIFNLSNDNAAVLEQFASGNRKAYLTGLAADVAADVDAVHDAWQNSYRNEFVASTGTSVGSSVSQLYNEFIKSYESIKNYKVGIPAGQRPGQVETEPELVEAYYSGKSVQMIKAHIDAIENIWYGRSRDGADGIGFREYLEKVEGGTTLITTTETQLDALHAVLDPISDTPAMSQQLVNDPAVFINLHNVLQQGLRFFKSDMSSILGIAITYSSGDGD